MAWFVTLVIGGKLGVFVMGLTIGAISYSIGATGFTIIVKQKLLPNLSNECNFSSPPAAMQICLLV